VSSRNMHVSDTSDHTRTKTGEWSGTGSAEGVERSATSNSDTSDICADVLKHDDIFYGAISDKMSQKY